MNAYQKALWSITRCSLTWFKFSKFSKTRSSKMVWNSSSIVVRRDVASRESTPYSPKDCFQLNVSKLYMLKRWSTCRMRVITSLSSIVSSANFAFLRGMFSAIDGNQGYPPSKRLVILMRGAYPRSNAFEGRLLSFRKDCIIVLINYIF